MSSVKSLARRSAVFCSLVVFVVDTISGGINIDRVTAYYGFIG